MYPFGFFQVFSFDVFLYDFFRFSTVFCFQVCSFLVIFPCFFQVFSCILLGFFRFSHLMFLGGRGGKLGKNDAHCERALFPGRKPLNVCMSKLG